MMSGKTDGQRACETYDRTLFHDGGHDEDIWATRGERERAAWEAIAAAGAAGAHERLENLAAKWEAEAADARPGANGASEAETASRKAAVRQKRICIRQLRQALSGDAPAITGAGTEHVAAQLAEEGR